MNAYPSSLNPVRPTTTLPWTINQPQRPVAVFLVVTVHVLVAILFMQTVPNLAGIAMIKQPQMIAVSLLNSRESNALVKPATAKPMTIPPQKPEQDRPTSPTQTSIDAPSEVAAASPAERANTTSALNPPPILQNKLQMPYVTPTATAARVDADYLDNPAPTYPAIAKRLNEQGSVILRVLVTPSGTAGEVAIKDSSGYPRLDRAAIEAVKRWKFIAASDGVVNISAWVIVPIHFSIHA